MLLFSVPFRSQIFDIFLDLVILPYFNAISIHFYTVKGTFILCDFHVCKWKDTQEF